MGAKTQGAGGSLVSFSGADKESGVILTSCFRIQRCGGTLVLLPLFPSYQGHWAIQAWKNHLSVCLEGKQTHNELYTFSLAMQRSRRKLLNCGLMKHELGSDEDGAAFML